MNEQLKICIERVLPNQTVPVKNASISLNKFDKLRAAFYTSKLWPNGSTINIGFMEDGDGVRRTSLEYIQYEGIPYDPLQNILDDLSPVDAVKTIVEERLQPIVGLKFVFINDPYNADIRISFQPTGAWSNIGTDCTFVSSSTATMNFGWLDVATVIHEFGHALGMIHEHQNPRGEPIKWDIPRVLEWAANPPNYWDETTTRHNIIDKYEENITNGSSFDPESIMLYYFPAYLTTNNIGTEQNQRLSKNDVIYLSNQYPGGKLSPNEFYASIYGQSNDESNDEFNDEFNDESNDEFNDEFNDESNDEFNDESNDESNEKTQCIIEQIKKYFNSSRLVIIVIIIVIIIYNLK